MTPNLPALSAHPFCFLSRYTTCYSPAALHTMSTFDPIAVLATLKKTAYPAGATDDTPENWATAFEARVGCAHRSRSVLRPGQSVELSVRIRL